MVGQKVKSLPAMQEARVRSLGQKDPLEEGMATHSSILGWRIPWTEEPGGLQFTGSQRVGHDFHLMKKTPIGLGGGYMNWSLIEHTLGMEDVELVCR